MGEGESRKEIGLNGKLRLKRPDSQMSLGVFSLLALPRIEVNKCNGLIASTDLTYRLRATLLGLLWPYGRARSFTLTVHNGLTQHREGLTPAALPRGARSSAIRRGFV